MMVIAHLLNELDIGGAQLVGIQRLEGLKNLGHEVMCITYRDGPAFHWLMESRIPYHVVKNKEEALQICMKYQVQVIHGHSCGGGSDAKYISEQLGIVGGDTVHSIVPGYVGPDFEISITQVSKDIRPQSTLIPLGVDITRLTPHRTRSEMRKSLGIPDSAYVIGRLGRLDGSKDPCGTIHVAHLLSHHKVYCVIGGGGDMLEAARELAASYFLKERVRFTGPSYSVGNFYNTLDCVVYPTIDENICAGTIEPMYVKTPVVCYIRGGMGQHVIHEQTALVANDYHGLAHQVERLILDESLGRRLGEAGYKRCEELGYWSLGGDVKRHEEVYLNCMKKKGMIPSSVTQ